MPLPRYAGTTLPASSQRSRAAAMCSALLLHVPIVLPLSFTSWMRRSGGAGRRASRSSSQSASARAVEAKDPAPLARLRTAVEAGGAYGYSVCSR